MPIWINQRGGTQEVSVLLFDRFSNYCLANTIEPMRAANDFLGGAAYRWRLVSLDGSPVVSSSGIRLMPDGKLADEPGGDALFVLPSYGYRKLGTPACLGALRAAARRFETLVGLDAGSWLLAEAGLLNAYAATIHFDEFDRFSEQFPEVNARRERWIIDRDRMSAGGATTAFELMQHLIAAAHGSAVSIEIAGLFMQGEETVRTLAGTAAGDRRVQRAVALMRDNLEAPLPIAEIARAAGCRQRDLETRFRRAFGTVPRTVYKQLRMAEALRLVREGDLAIAEIAVRCGYGDASAFTRAFRRTYGQTPRSHSP
ncbi:GlxA family transcriptional regulator [Nisaea acidiphila]|uniref:GlxA family transcriptional regulator n=1 Tax=Nisaea acidiphila TaxID=1862145 RepID=A0A9J7AQF2_9PROT|nr:GlxA family transcriptional regulator [Nisaea acidiphila]UUX48825.1 GlxA family transcriptional regulator [Nisaea acidiphila]